MAAIYSAAEMPAFPMRHVNPKCITKATVHCLVGSDGAITVTTDNPDVSVAKNGSTTGQYDVTFPPSLGVKPVVSYVYASSTTIAARGNVAPSAGNGTWSVLFFVSAGTGAWPASTDQFDIHLEFETEPV
jgi:hypothetical protein